MNPQSSLANSAIFKSSIPDPFPFSIELSEINWLQIGWRICLPNHPMVTEVLVTRMTTRRNLATELHILYHWMSLNKPVINLISSGSRLLSDCPLPWKRFNRESFIYQTCRTCGHRDKQIPSKLTACHIFAPSCLVPHAFPFVAEMFMHTVVLPCEKIGMDSCSHWNSISCYWGKTKVNSPFILVLWKIVFVCSGRFFTCCCRNGLA